MQAGKALDVFGVRATFHSEIAIKLDGLNHPRRCLMGHGDTMRNLRLGLDGTSKGCGAIQKDFSTQINTLEC